MLSQTRYYNRFGHEFKEAILSCPQPQWWTTDYEEKGRIFREMKERIAQQEALIDAYFTPALPVLDVGCGFGRQAFLLAKKGFSVSGIDTSRAFVDIAAALFRQHRLQGRFLCLDVLSQPLNERFAQVLLLDVLEHISPPQRKPFLEKIAGLLPPEGILLLSLPQVKKRWRSQVNNNFRKAVTQHLSFFRNHEEHPYPVPQEKETKNLLQKHFHLLYSNTANETGYYAVKKL